MKILVHAFGQVPLLRDMTAAEEAATRAVWDAAAAAAATPLPPSLGDKVAALQARMDAVETTLDSVATASGVVVAKPVTG